MSRLESASVDRATGATAKLYDAIKSNLGSVPNLFQALGSNPKVLKVYLGLGAGQTSLNAQEKEMIALVVAQVNGCGYCLAAHTALGKLVDFKEEEIVSIRRGQVSDPKLNALLQFTREVVFEKGRVSNETFEKLLENGYTKAQVPEIILAVVGNAFTNYFNQVNQTPIDFPSVQKI